MKLLFKKGWKGGALKKKMEKRSKNNAEDKTLVLHMAKSG